MKELKKKKTRGYRNLGKDLHKNKVMFFNIPNMTVCLKPHFGDNRVGPRVTLCGFWGSTTCFLATLWQAPVKTQVTST